jgi:hypothetical protein
MSFTEDELQSLNTILEQRLIAHRQAMECSLDQRMKEYRHELDRRLATTEADFQRDMTRKLSDFQIQLESILSEKLNVHQERIIQIVHNDVEQRQNQFDDNIDHMLATQLLGIEQLINQNSSRNQFGEIANRSGIPAQVEAIEVQTDLPWEDLMDVIGKALDQRLSLFNDAIQRSLKNLEQFLSARIYNLRDDFLLHRTLRQEKLLFQGENPTSIHEVIHGIEQLERIIESMQVAMTSNHALLSNRLFHHQQLPLERAHSSGDHPKSIPKGMNNPLTIKEEQVTNGVEPGRIPGQTEMEE